MSEIRLSKYHKSDVQYKSYQEECLIHLVGQPRSLVVLPVGLGKTLVALSLFSYLKEKAPDMGCIFFTKKSVVEQIPIELGKFFDGLSCQFLYEDTPDYRKFVYHDFGDGNIDVLASTYDNIRRDFDLIESVVAKRAPMLVFDEATVIKNSSSKIYGMVEKLASYSPRVIALSGTPVMNRLEDLYNIFYSVGIPICDLKTFRRDICVWENVKIWKRPKGMSRAIQINVPRISGYKNVGAFFDQVSPFMFSRKKSEVSDLPGFTLNKYRLDETASIRDAMTRAYKEHGKKVPYGILQYATSAPSIILGDDSPSIKVEQILEIIEEIEGDKCLIYSPFTRPLYYMRDILLSNGIPESSICMIEGDTRDRQHQVEVFSGDGRFMLMTDAAAQGVNGLQVAKHIIFYNLPIVAGQFIQICGRISRVDTEHKELHLHVPLIRSTVDWDIWTILQNQFRLIGKVSGDSIEEGVVDPEVRGGEIGSLDDVDKWMRERIQNRYSKYVKEK